MGFWGTLTGGQGTRPRGFDTQLIAYAKIALPTKSGTNIPEHIFHNPDDSSPVAAVSIKTINPHTQVELYSREGRSDEVRERMTDLHMQCYEAGAGIHPLSLDAFQPPIDKVSFRLIGAEEEITLDPARHKDTPNQEILGKVFNDLRSTNILSDDAAKRDAMVRRMYEEIPLLEAAVERANPSAPEIGS